MKVHYFLLFIFSTFISHAQVTFEKSLEQAFSRAKTEQKLVLIELYSSNCSICQKVNPMFNDKEIGDFYNKHFVVYKIDLSKETSQKDVDFIVKKGLHVDGVPKFIFFDQNQKFIHFSGISPDKKAFFDVGEAAIDPAKQLSKTPELFAAGDRSLKLLYAYSSYALLYDNVELANQIADELYKALPKENLSSVSSYYLLKNAVFTTDNGIFKYWIANLDKLKGFEMGSREGKEIEEIHRIIGQDLNNKNRVWTAQNLKDIRGYIQKSNYSGDVDMLLWEKELAVMVKENKVTQANDLLKKMVSKNIKEPQTLLYILNQFALTAKNRENLLYAKAQIDEILTVYKNPKNKEEQDLVNKLKAVNK
jgi:thioredoxin-related protein